MDTSNVGILVIGSAGMLGRKLVERILRDGHLGGRQISELLLADVVPTEVPAHAPADTRVFVTDISQPGAAAELVKSRPQVIFHLAAVVSGEAEADFDKGYRINFDGSRALFEAIRQQGYVPRLVFTSSMAVFGAPFPESIPDTFFTTPLSSYGTQKAMVELLLADYSRRGFLDGIGIRLPTISIRPGKPNRAASGFYSSILREPLNGKEAVLPVDESMRTWFASPRAAIGFMIHAANIDSAALGGRRNLTMPGLSATVGDQLAALKRVAGEAAVALVKREPDPAVAKIVTTWPQRFEATSARALGFVAESTFDEIIAVYREDEMSSGARYFKDHFSSNAVGYAAYRPTYPMELVDALARISPSRALALDCGCGTGQLSVLLAERFDQVIATDASAAQIEQAQPHERVRYRAALAEDSALPDRSVDLVTVAQAAHWLNLDNFYAEVRRVARPNAVIALITYGVLHVEGDVDPLVQRFYHETIGPYWPAERRHVEDGYRNLPFPFQETRLADLAIEVTWSLDDLVGYINTWSAVKAAEKVLGANPAGQFEHDLRGLWGDAATRRRVTWPLSLRVGHVAGK